MKENFACVDRTLLRKERIAYRETEEKLDERYKVDLHLRSERRTSSHFKIFRVATGVTPNSVQVSLFSRNDRQNPRSGDDLDDGRRVRSLRLHLVYIVTLHRHLGMNIEAIRSDTLARFRELFSSIINHSLRLSCRNNLFSLQGPIDTVANGATAINAACLTKRASPGNATSSSNVRSTGCAINCDRNRRTISASSYADAESRAKG